MELLKNINILQKTQVLLFGGINTGSYCLR